MGVTWLREMHGEARAEATRPAIDPVPRQERPASRWQTPGRGTACEGTEVERVAQATRAIPRQRPATRGAANRAGCRAAAQAPHLHGGARCHDHRALARR